LLGLRPGQANLVADADDGALCTSIYAHEMIGRELQPMLPIADDLVRCRTAPPVPVSVGEPVRVRPTRAGAASSTGRVLDGSDGARRYGRG
jgi:hypothetical protein